MKSFFTPKDITTLTKLSYRQIQYWDRTGFISPSYKRKGRYRLYTFADLLQLKLAKTLRDEGWSIQTLRGLLRSVRSLLAQVKHPIVDVTFLIMRQRVLIFNGDLYLNRAFKESTYLFKVEDFVEQIEDTWPTDHSLPDVEIALN